MAKFYPEYEFAIKKCKLQKNTGERIILALLHDGLDDNFIVFHSLSYLMKNSKKRFVDGEADFVVFDKRKGFICLEVKGGTQIMFKDAAWWYAPGKPMKNPFEQGVKAKFTLKDYFISVYNKNPDFTYAHAVGFPMTVFDAKTVTADADKTIVIDRGNCDNLRERFEKIFISSGYRENRTNLSEIAGFISHLTKEYKLNDEIDALYPLLNEDIKGYENELDDFTETFPGSNIIVGGAGTGKTYLAVKKMESIGEDRRLAYFCFNKNLAEMVTKKIVGRSNITIKNIHKYARDMAQDSVSLKAGGCKIDIIFKIDDNLTGIENQKCAENFDFIIVDEVQDFNLSWVLFLENMLNPGGTMWLLGDEDQNLYGKNFFGEFVPGKLKIQYGRGSLKTNRRNTANIHICTVDKTGLGTGMKINKTKGLDPKFFSFKQGATDEIINEMGKTLIELTPALKQKKASMVILTDRKENIFSASNILKIGDFNLTNNCFDDDSCKIPFLTVHAFKGLEADYVLYLQHNRNYSIRDRRINYEAYTRAKMGLYVFECRS